MVGGIRIEQYLLLYGLFRSSGDVGEDGVCEVGLSVARERLGSGRGSLSLPSLPRELCRVFPAPSKTKHPSPRGLAGRTGNGCFEGTAECVRPFLQRARANLLFFRKEHGQDQDDHYDPKYEFASCLSRVLFFLFNLHGLHGLFFFRQQCTPVRTRFSFPPLAKLCTICIGNTHMVTLHISASMIYRSFS